MATRKPKMVFFGSEDSGFSMVILEILKKSGFSPALFLTAKKEAPTQEIKKLEPDLFVIASYGKILTKELLAIPKRGALNVHPSLLPKYRGPTPIQAAILNGDEKTGVSIILADEKIDHGPILAAQELEFSIFNYQFSNLQKELAELGGELLIKTIPHWLAGKIQPQEQDHSKATYTKKITKEDGHINWQEPAEIIERKIRAFNPWPGAYSFWQKSGKKQRLILLKAQSVRHTMSDKIGKALKTDDGFAVQTGKGALKIQILKPEGKKEMPASAFLKGNSEILGQILG